ncbi:MAG: GGDEF domain-containing protein [Pleurocapsa minor GSE-CHR-MK-17-07R]|nr:GGDEF domain-containing protein [Pleurocapsa minor GSE-CHR-MK 17-07R]
MVLPTRNSELHAKFLGFCQTLVAADDLALMMAEVLRFAVEVTGAQSAVCLIYPQPDWCPEGLLMDNSAGILPFDASGLQLPDDQPDVTSISGDGWLALGLNAERLGWVFLPGGGYDMDRLEMLSVPVRMGIASFIRAQQLRQQVTYLQTHDHILTKLPNRLYFHQKLAELIASPVQNLAILVVDIDDFKRINRFGGHSVGDQFIYHVGQMLAQVADTLPGSTILARMGGDEFAFILIGADRAAAAQAGTLVLESLRRPFMVQTATFQTTASLGICLYPHDGNSVSELLQNADIAMYRAKEGGKDQYRFFQQ